MFSFFGSRKKSPENEDSTEEASSSDPARSANDYVFVERRQDAPGYGNSEVYPTLPYPVAPPSFRPPEAPASGRGSSSSSSGSAVANQNSLSGVPFKLSSKAEYDADSFLGADLSEIMYQIRHLDLSSFEYDFTVEKSVLREVGQENFQP
ncbi:uncharacterized protein LOC134537020 [Bacillus rossius redtenbacheri]|uniref:uncharacterized protein LOC134537020 n=1 Tax=Bacillus rossius redtenbacheri TaxID=93214 RepID=UPI002FDD1980